LKYEYKFFTVQINHIFRSLKNKIASYPKNKLVVKESLIPQSGNGLFIEGNINRGKLVSFYPGRIWTSKDIDETLSALQNQSNPSQNSFIISQLDQCFVFNNSFIFSYIELI